MTSCSGGRATTPYQSAFDFPSFVEMTEQLRAMGLLTRVVMRRMRPDVERISSSSDGHRLDYSKPMRYAAFNKRHWSPVRFYSCGTPTPACW